MDQLDSIETLSGDCVLIVGGGPVGLILASTLAYYGIKSILLERNLTTTRWPKMDLTTARSMEIFRRLGIADELRRRGVASNMSFNCLFSSGLGAEKAITSWQLPSVDQVRAQIASLNDGTLPLEPWQRVSQEVFEAWLKEKCDNNPMIDVRFGWKAETAEELDSGARLTAVNLETGFKKTFFSRYAVGCDGASSKLRQDLGVELEGGPISLYALLVHFKSKDLTRLHRQGQFWHIFFLKSTTNGGGMHGAIIAQDEIDTWTVHRFLPVGFDDSTITSEDAVYSALGGMGEPYKIKIDEILVRSTWRPSVAVAKAYSGPKQRILLAGDACHQTIPSGGYGMNMGIAEAFDLGWKLAATINGWGGPNLLSSYEEERRPVTLMSVEWSKIHTGRHLGLSASINVDASTINSDNEEGKKTRHLIDEYYKKHDAQNQSFGVEMGYRYVSGICLLDEMDKRNPPPEWDHRNYIPTTYPGYRAPHVFLNDGSPIFDKYSKEFTLIVFSDGKDPTTSKYLQKAAQDRKIPLKIVSLIGEDHARNVWGANLVLVRPDGHVSWRGEYIKSRSAADRIILTATGHCDRNGNERGRRESKL